MLLDLQRPFSQVRAAFGGIDSKVTSKALVNLGRCQAQSGPTHDQVPPFEWNDADWPGVAHIGQPKASPLLPFHELGPV